MIDDPGPVARYKAVLARVIETRPSGARRRLADALGKHPSFVSQITSPLYATPIPPADVPLIFEICHFSDTDRAAFLTAYRDAHPRRARRLFGPELGRGEREVTLRVPDWGDAALNAEFDEMLRQTARRAAHFAARLATEGEDA
jgi:hypothetical protein